MSFNPQTLIEETEEERKERVVKTGVLGRGLTVLCYPTDEPDVFQQQHRAVCIIKPYEKCPRCPHSRFKALFRAGIPEVKQELVMCPKWDTKKAEVEGRPPDRYVSGQVGTCDEQPFDFCRKCPTRSELTKLGIDKKVDGWLNRWTKYTRDEDEDVDD